MVARIPDTTRTAILDDIRAGRKSCRAIAKDHGVSPGTVSALARENGLTFERSDRKTRADGGDTKAATRARRFDAKAARADMLELLHGDALKLRERAWTPYTTVIGSGDGARFVTMKLPPLRDQREAYVALAICLDKAAALELHDDDGGAAQGKTMINDLMGVFHLAYHQQVDEQAEPEVDLTAPTDTGVTP